LYGRRKNVVESKLLISEGERSRFAWQLISLCVLGEGLETPPDHDPKGQSSSTKGRGLIAIVPISCGQTVVDEAPLVMVEGHSRDVPDALFEIDQRLHESGKVVLRLAIPAVLQQVDEKLWHGLSRASLGLQAHLDARSVVDALHHHCPHTQSFSTALWDELLAVLIANNYATPNGGAALFLTGSMLNHSCKPNCTLIGYMFVASRDIAAGEELTVSYCPADMESEIRRKLLLRNYGFECTCELCCSNKCWEVDFSTSSSH